MIFADTSVWIDYFNGVMAPHTEILDSALQNSRIVTGDLILIELLQGFRKDSEYRLAKNLMQCLEYRNMVGKEIALKTAQNFRILQSKGITIRKTIDMIIGTFCIESSLPLLHHDRDFDPMETHLGLKIINHK
ncbi:MAG: PIN domain nuclease [Candidatus Cloacimonetes bacterium]|nr:PIN domain nuclease [Candidatus Cloacimonadota bacterium]